MLYLGEVADDLTCALVRAATKAIEQKLDSVLIDLVPSYTSILIIYDPLHTDHLSIRHRVRNAIENLDALAPAEGRAVLLPVYYSTEAGEDLPRVAEHSQLSVEAVIEIHASNEYRVYAIGFAPGFAFLGQLDQRIAMPRLRTPRTLVPKGSVAIADSQTAVYPAASPGGWNLIGRCPVAMFDPFATPCMPLSVGDRVRFEPISRERFLDLGGDLT
jgi:KipI family sensor histidine kinase inhibitor